MSQTTNNIYEQLYETIRNQFKNISMVDEKGQPTVVGKDCRFFNMLFSENDPESMVTISLLDPASIKIYFDKNLTARLNSLDKVRWYDFISNLRGFSVPRQLTFDLLDIENPGLTAADVRAMIQSNQANNVMIESKFSKLEGTKRSSVQALENYRIKARHRATVNDSVHGARSRNITALFIENNQGERFKFPVVELSGARAMARHLEEGGRWQDKIGLNILEMSHNISTIKKFVREARAKNICNENVNELFEQLRNKLVEYKRKLRLMNGSRGYRSYTENLAETFVEPVESVTRYFTSIPESMQTMLPAIERILGEKTAETAVDKSLLEYINSLSSITGIVEQVQQSMFNEEDDEEEHKFKLKMPPDVSNGKPERVTENMLRRMNITKNPKTLYKQVPQIEQARMKKFAQRNNFYMPVFIDNGKTLSPKEREDLYKLLFLLANYDASKVRVYIQSSDEAGDDGSSDELRPKKGRIKVKTPRISRIGKAGRAGYEWGLDPLGQLRQAIYKKTGI